MIVGTTNASLFAYVADGKNGLKVLQLTSPESQPNFYGFSPEPKPQLIADQADRAARRWRCPRASTATGRSTRPATRSRCSAASARARSRARRWPSSISTANGNPWFVTDRVDERRAAAP